MIHDLRCQVSGTVVGTIDLPDNMPADEVLRRTYTESGVVAEGYSLPKPVPEAASPATIRVALRRLHGVSNSALDATVAAVIDSLPSDEQDDAETMWLYSVSIRRDHPLVAAVGQVLALSSSQIDEVFRIADTI
ncbi:MAG: hypothetical protein EBR82_31535 [Caulobacteraceae bacterium]|nr:hypothetical protein [Caulobacteraceae bacterium]